MQKEISSRSLKYQAKGVEDPSERFALQLLLVVIIVWREPSLVHAIHIGALPTKITHKQVKFQITHLKYLECPKIKRPLNIKVPS